MPLTAPHVAQLDDIARRVADDGVDSHRAAVRRIVREARRSGVGGVLAEIVSDTTEPSIVRQRAFGDLVALLGRPGTTSAEGQRPRPRITWPAHAA